MANICWHFNIYEHDKIWVQHVESFITLGHVLLKKNLGEYKLGEYKTDNYSQSILFIAHHMVILKTFFKHK